MIPLGGEDQAWRFVHTGITPDATITVAFDAIMDTTARSIGEPRVGDRVSMSNSYKMWIGERQAAKCTLTKTDTAGGDPA